MKIHSARLRKAKWNLTLPLIEARRNDEIISLSDSQVLRWIDELNGVVGADHDAKTLKKRIKSIKNEPSSLQNRREIKRLYECLDRIQFKPDYLHLIIDSTKDYYRACKGFTINGVKYVRLLGTNGGVKNSTIVFVSDRLATVLRERIDNGRDQSIPQVPAKFEAYRALACSGSTPVSTPHGILVVNDCETQFYEDIISLSDENGGEPEMVYKEHELIKLVESDGYGLMCPALAWRWSDELRLGYVASGMNTRCSWEKGMVFCFDFHRFADEVAHTYIVKDAWGHDVDIRNVELILTTSMLKLWKCYDSIEHYLECCAKNHYTFGIAKTCPKMLESSRDLNYQFIQSYNLNDEQIDELIAPTIQDIKDVLYGDYRKAILYLCGTHLTADSVMRMEGGFAKAMMADPRVYDDPFIKHKLYQMIRKRIDDAKIGVIRVHGNYSIVSGDPYSLCQSVFGLPVTGLLRKGEVYNKYWVDHGADKVVCFRAPMTCHNNIRLCQIATRDELEDWYQYMTTCTIFNSWDSSAHALNGMDKDGDLVMLTDNPVLVSNTRQLPTIMCAQRTATKIPITEASLIQANIDSFGDDIGKTTNWITTMFEVQSQFEPGSKEYEMLDYRIKCGQLYQQNAIDKAKGIIANPMPRYWHDWHAAIAMDDAHRDEDGYVRQTSILAEKKPYFMRYIYPDLMRSYKSYMNGVSSQCCVEFMVDIDSLLEKADKTERESEFAHYFNLKMPVGTHQCVMNKICKRFESEFDGYRCNTAGSSFDYTVLRGNVEYTQSQLAKVTKLYVEYMDRSREHLTSCSGKRETNESYSYQRLVEMEDFERKCLDICSNAEQLCNILLDICYNTEKSKQFCWDMCSDAIVSNLLSKNGMILRYPTRDEDGELDSCGIKFKMEEMAVI